MLQKKEVPQILDSRVVEVFEDVIQDQVLGTPQELHSNEGFPLVSEREVAHFSVSVSKQIEQFEEREYLRKKPSFGDVLADPSVVEELEGRKRGTEQASSFLVIGVTGIMSELKGNVLRFVVI